MVKIANFLCCLKLETGGLILGWTSFISNILGLISIVLGIIGLTVLDCNRFEAMVNKFAENPGGVFQGDAFNKFCTKIRIFVLVALGLAFLMHIGFTYMAYLLIKGTNARDHVRVKPMMVLYAVLNVLSLFLILSSTPLGIILGLLYGCIYGYFFVVLYSLYGTFKKEYERSSNANKPQQVGKV